jgi:hypothetical protein
MSDFFGAEVMTEAAVFSSVQLDHLPEQAVAERFRHVLRSSLSRPHSDAAR